MNRSAESIHAILVHGMGRTPASMLWLASRLRRAGLKPALFAYSATFERWAGCVRRLQRFIERHAGGERYVIVAHSLGTVLTRGVLPQLRHKPLACFFLAPPARACHLARRLAPLTIYRVLTGEMGQLLADEAFMAGLPSPDVPTAIYAGTAGPRGRHLPFGAQPNDGILTVTETRLAEIPHRTVPALHTFLMNSETVADDIVRTVDRLSADGGMASVGQLQ